MARIFLIGFMGSGKSTLGRELAGELGFTFFDLDKEIEEKEGVDIPRIFATHGETYFRQSEKRTLESILERDDMVVATGGGAPCFYDNMVMMNRSGITIYLRVPPETLHERLIFEKSSRPLIAGLSADQLRGYIKNELAAREKFYMQARMVIHEPLPPVKEILSQLETYTGLDQ